MDPLDVFGVHAEVGCWEGGSLVFWGGRSGGRGEGKTLGGGGGYGKGRRTGVIGLVLEEDAGDFVADELGRLVRVAAGHEEVGWQRARLNSQHQIPYRRPLAPPILAEGWGRGVRSCRLDYLWPPCSRLGSHAPTS